MKTRIILMLAGLLLLNSCILKSLQPFYIAKAISYEENLLGNWQDNERGTWSIDSFKKLFKEDQEDFSKLSKEDIAVYNKYKDAYIITYTKKDKEASFIGMPFKINGKLFIDFTPFESGLENINNLLAQHIVKAHSIAKIEQFKNNKLKIKWLDESKIEDLQKQNKIRLQHEKIGLDGTFIITATSEELYKFLEKFETSNEDDIWGTSSQITLMPANAKP